MQLKKVVILLSSVLFSISVLAQVGQAKLTGTVWNFTNPNYILISPMVNGVAKDTVMLDEKGTFEYTYELQSATYFSLYHGAHSYIVFMGPEDEIDIVLGNLWYYNGTVSFEGDRGYNELLLAQTEFNQQTKSIDRQQMFLLPYDQFFNYLDSVVDARTNELEAMVGTLENPDQNFINVQTALYSYWKAEAMLTYSIMPHQVAPDSAAYSSYYTDFFVSLPLNQPGLLLFEEYYNFLVRYVDNSVRSRLATDAEIQQKLGGPFWATFDMIKSMDVDDAIKDYMYYRTIDPYLQKGSVSDIIELLESYSEYSSNVGYNQMVRAYYDYWVKPAVGSDVPDLGLVDVDGNAVSLDQFAGKYVYIDVWATWCGPCKAEIPHLKALGEELADKNIAFVGVSTDQDVAKWTNYLSTNEMHGTQVHAGGGFTISSHFQVSSIPRFIILDKEGKVLNPRAPRPSTPATKYYLLGLEGI